MPIIELSAIEDDKPELVLGLVAAVGTPLRNICRIIGD